MGSGELTGPQQVGVWDARVDEITRRTQDPDRELVERVPLLEIKHKRALDIGCGGGRHLVWLARSGWVATGLDWSPKAIAAARRLLDANRLKATLVKGDFKRLPFEPASFTLIISTSTLHHAKLADFRRALMEIKRVLRIGGYALIALPTTMNLAAKSPGSWAEQGTLIPSEGEETGIPHHFFTEPEVREAAKMFREVRVEPGIANWGMTPEDEVTIGADEWFWVTLKG